MMIINWDNNKFKNLYWKSLICILIDRLDQHSLSNEFHIQTKMIFWTGNSCLSTQIQASTSKALIWINEIKGKRTGEILISWKWTPIKPFSCQRDQEFQIVNKFPRALINLETNIECPQPIKAVYTIKESPRKPI